MELLSLLPLLITAAIFIFILALIALYMTSEAYPYLGRYNGEKYFFSPKKNERVPFPSLHDTASVDLSVVVPAYNEEQRLPTMMDEAMEYLENRQSASPSFSYEVIVVDDGSKDKTTKKALEYSRKYDTDKVRVLTLEKNRGKGGAIRLGMFVARGKYLLFADADGATTFSDYVKLEKEMSRINKNSNNLAVVCGSRAHLEEESIAQRSAFRTFLMKGFHFIVWFLCVRCVKDTQCGFKLLTRDTAVLLFSNLHVERWAFDVDLLYIAQYLSIPVTEVAVQWTEIEGSKLVPVWSWLQMGRDILLIKLKYLIGAWKINSKPKRD